MHVGSFITSKFNDESEKKGKRGNFSNSSPPRVHEKVIDKSEGKYFA